MTTINQGLENAMVRLNQIEAQLKGRSSLPSWIHDSRDYSHLLKQREELAKFIRENKERKPMGAPAAPHANPHLQKEGTMLIEFESEPSDLTFSMVHRGQLFVSEAGSLYQKSRDSENEAWCICNPVGEAEGSLTDFDAADVIKRILPKVRRISF